MFRPRVFELDTMRACLAASFVATKHVLRGVKNAHAAPLVSL
jgi:hypothetical protein